MRITANKFLILSAILALLIVAFVCTGGSKKSKSEPQATRVAEVKSAVQTNAALPADQSIDFAGFQNTVNQMSDQELRARLNRISAMMKKNKWVEKFNRHELTVQETLHLRALTLESSLIQIRLAEKIN